MPHTSRIAFLMLNGIKRASMLDAAFDPVAAPGTRPLAATVTKAAYLGSVMEYSLDSAIGPLFVVHRGVEAPLAAGAAVAVVLQPHGMVAIPRAAEEALRGRHDRRKLAEHHPNPGEGT